jgi:hypothetical protein
MNVAMALIVADRKTLSVVRSICTRRATVTAAPTMPQTDARRACSKLNAASTLPRAITRKQASQAPANFSAAGRTRPLSRKSPNASIILCLLGIGRPLFLAARPSPRAGRQELRHRTRTLGLFIELITGLAAHPRRRTAAARPPQSTEAAMPRSSFGHGEFLACRPLIPSRPRRLAAAPWPSARSPIARSGRAPRACPCRSE